MPSILLPASATVVGSITCRRRVPAAMAALVIAAPARNLRRFRYRFLGVISDERMSAIFLISIRCPCLYVRRFRPTRIANRELIYFQSIGRHEYRKVARLRVFYRAFHETGFYPSTSRTLRERLCRVNGFCRNALPLSMVPSLTMVSSV